MLSGFKKVRMEVDLKNRKEVGVHKGSKKR
jgi:hypothetical protein